MIFSHYLERLKQDDYDKVPKITSENEKNEGERPYDPTAFTR